MDQSSEVANFEEYLRKNLKKTIPIHKPLYRNSNQVEETIYKPRDVLLNISTQLKAIQRADTVKCERKHLKNLQKYRKSGFLPVNELPIHEEVPKQPTPSNKFDTQCVTDTQLINIIEDAEALNAHKGMMQEFDQSFSHAESGLKDRVVNNGEDVESQILVINCNKDDRKSDIGTDLNNVQACNLEQDKATKIGDVNKRLENSINTHTDNTLPELLINCIEIIEEDSERPLSPIFNHIKPIIKSRNPSPLVYTLKSFEEFEKLAVPLIEDNMDMDKAKHLINSQILGKELCLHKDTRFMVEQLSPVLEIKKDKDKKLDVVKEKSNDEAASSQIHNNSLEDEILFSSDEELDYIHKEFQDLPFTCALETSFYDTSDVLDKTMYVGFQTASNKSIQINSDSFTKAQSILTDFDNDFKRDPTLTELVEVYDGVKCDDEQSEIESIVKAVEVGYDEEIETNDNNIKSNGHTKEDTNEKSNKILLIIDNIVTDSNKSTAKRNCDEFITNSNKRIKLSEQALAKCRKVIQDKVLDTSTKQINTKNKEEITLKKNDVPKSPKTNIVLKCAFENELELKNKVIDNIIQDKINDDLIIQEFENIEMSLEEDKSVKEDNFVGFKTASKKNISISNDALKKCQQIFKDIDLDEQINENSSKDVILETKINANKGKDELHKNNIEVFKEGTVPKFSEFSTASDKNNKISVKALDNSINIFKDRDHTDLAPNNILQETKQIMNIDYNQPSTSKATFGGFKTANNEDIKISKVALAKTNNIFKDIDKKEYAQLKNKDTCGLIGLNTTSSKQGTISDVLLAKSKVLCQDKDIFHQIDSTKILPPKAPDLDFLKSNDKLVNISEPALIRSCKLFQCNHVMNNEISTSQNIVLAELPAGFEGFKTASNKTVNISTKALANTKKIFQDIHISNEEPVKSVSEFQSSQTASNRVVKVSKDAVAEIKDTAFDSKVDNAVTKFQGFKTASNKALKISDAALVKSKKLFQNIDSINYEIPLETENNSRYETNLAFQGFKTASNKAVKISNEALIKSKKLLQDFDSIIDEMPLETKSNSGNLNNLACQGFKMASNKAVKISDEALLKSKKRLQDIDSLSDVMPLETKSNSRNETNLAFQGFKTASNKAVKISDEALLKSKKLLQDIDSISDEMPLETKSNSRNETNLAIKGFKTASNKAVKIADEALLKSKKLLQDIDSNINEMPTESKVWSQNVASKGFMTANNKAVKIDDQALAKSKKLFEDIHLDIENDTEISKFEGFKTGNNKAVAISENTLATSRKVFDDIGCSQILNMGFKGFQTANKQQVNISEDAFIKSKKLFQDIDLDVPKNNKKANKLDINKEESLKQTTKENFARIDNDPTVKSDAKTKCDIVEIIDTQVLNDFEETVYTEDFRNSPKRNKRSGSPILSCPRAKKRKFETPYKAKEISPKVIKSKEVIVNENHINFIFDGNYKKNKRYTLKDILKLEEGSTKNTDKYILSFNYDNLLDFEFNRDRNDINNHNITINDLKDIFLTSVNKKLIPNGWIENHLQLIVWKLVSYEIKFPKAMDNVCTAKNVIEQLKYRYDKELYDAQRPVLRRILEKDDSSMRSMVLCVVKIFVDGINVDSVANTTNNIELLLTDGWYCVKATIDRMLAKLVCDDKIVVGTKIVTNGAELVNCEQGIAPWEDTSLVRLKIFGNSTRRARWDARLGCHGNAAMLTHLSTVKLDGGKVSKLRVLVTRVYPTLYVEKFEDGSTVTRSERLEHLHQMKYEAERQVLMEKLYEEVEKEFADQESQDSEGSFNASNKRTCLDSGSQIAKMMKRSKDPEEVKNNLSRSQHALLNQYTNAHRERILQDIQDRIRQKMANNGVCTSRNVVPVMKIRISDVGGRNDVEVTKGMMSIWKPNDAIQEIITEGAWIDVMNVVPTAIRYSEIQISAGRQSVFSLAKYKEPEKLKPYTKLLKRTCYLIKDLASNPTFTTDYNEIDTVGMIFSIDPSITDFESMKAQSFQNLYLADADKNIICVNFWGGLKKFGFENVLDTGQIVSCTNLQKRAGNTKKNIPQYRVTEFTYFTKTPKHQAAQKIMDDLNKKLLGLDKRKFCEDCLVLRNNFAICKVQNNENISPYRLNNSDYNISKHRMFIDTPKRIDEFNLTGLDFESTFKQTESQELSPKSLERKRRVNEKISKLRMYGEPPPLSKIHILNKSKNVSSTYKSPLNSDVSNSVVSIKKYSEDSPKTAILGSNSRIDCSPIISMNKTYVKRCNVNPVKLNFSNNVANEENSVTDDFADEFDASPPLSLE